MTFELNRNTPVCGTRPDGSEVAIVCDTNLTPAFFDHAGVTSLPKGTSVFIGYGKETQYTISGNGPEVKINATLPDAREQVGKVLIARGAQPKAAA